MTTKRIIANEGIDHFLPTACYPSQRHLTVLTGLPDHLDPGKPILEWAAKAAQTNEGFLVAFAIDSGHFKIIRCVGPFSENETYSVS